MIIYVIGEVIDLGVHPVISYTSKEKAQEVCDEMIRNEINKRIKLYMEQYNLTHEEAKIRASSYEYFTISEIELIDANS